MRQVVTALSWPQERALLQWTDAAMAQGVRAWWAGRWGRACISRAAGSEWEHWPPECLQRGGTTREPELQLKWDGRAFTYRIYISVMHAIKDCTYKITSSVTIPERLPSRLHYLYMLCSTKFTFAEQWSGRVSVPWWWQRELRRWRRWCGPSLSLRPSANARRPGELGNRLTTYLDICFFIARQR